MGLSDHPLPRRHLAQAHLPCYAALGLCVSLSVSAGHSRCQVLDDAPILRTLVSRTYLICSEKINIFLN